MRLTWAIPGPPLQPRWAIGATASAPPVSPTALGAVVALLGPRGAVGPRGLQGEVGQPVRFQAGASATWTFEHAFGRVPQVSVFVGNGELVLADVSVSETQIIVTHAQPVEGFVLAL